MKAFTIRLENDNEDLYIAPSEGHVVARICGDAYIIMEAPSPWKNLAEEAPTKETSDYKGRVFYSDPNGNIAVGHYSSRGKVGYWMTPPPLPELSQEMHDKMACREAFAGDVDYEDYEEAFTHGFQRALLYLREPKPKKQ